MFLSIHPDFFHCELPFTGPPYPLPIPPVNHAGLLRASLSLQPRPPSRPVWSTATPFPLLLPARRRPSSRPLLYSRRRVPLGYPMDIKVIRSPAARSTRKLLGEAAWGRASSPPGERRRGLLGVCSPAGSADRERPGRAGIVVVIVQPQGSTLLLLLGGRCVQGKPTRRGTNWMRRAADPHQGKRHTRPARVPMPASKRRTKLRSLHHVATSSSTCSMICVNRGPRPCRLYDYTSLPASNP
jgi:hypothetical protein